MSLSGYRLTPPEEVAIGDGGRRTPPPSAGSQPGVGACSNLRPRGDDNQGMDDQDPFGMSAYHVAANVGTVLLVGLAALGLYGVGIVLAYVGVVSQPGGVTTGIAVAYVLLAVVAPVAIARKMRSSGATWRGTSAVCAFVVLAVSILFFPFAALPMVFSA